MRENNKNKHCTHKDKERKYIRVMANLFSITIGWLCEHFYWRGVHMLAVNFIKRKESRNEKISNYSYFII